MVALVSVSENRGGASEVLAECRSGRQGRNPGTWIWAARFRLERASERQESSFGALLEGVGFGRQCESGRQEGWNRAWNVDLRATKVALSAANRALQRSSKGQDLAGNAGLDAMKPGTWIDLGARKHGTCPRLWICVPGGADTEPSKWISTFAAFLERAGSSRQRRSGRHVDLGV